MRRFVRALALSGIGVASTACPDPPRPPVSTTQSTTSSPFVTLHLSGSVVDLDGQGIAGVALDLIGMKATTDSAGHFELSVLVVNGAALTVSAAGPMCVGAEALIKVTSTNLHLDIKAERIFSLPIDRSESGVLRPKDPPISIGDWDPLTSLHTRHYRITTPTDSDVTVELSWERVGNAELQLWALGGGLTSTLVGDRQVIRLPRNRSDVLWVVQPSHAGALTQPVSFTLVTKRVQ